MRVIFCTRLYDPAKYASYCQKAGHVLSLADPNFIYSFVQGIESNIEGTVNLVNISPIPGFPSYPELFVRDEIWSHKDGERDFECGYINLPFLKQYSRYCSVYKNLRKLMKETDEEEIYLLTYDLNLDACKAIQKIKKRYPSVKTTVILPDIPVLMKSVRGIRKGTYRDRYVDRQMTMLKKFDYYVLVAENMKKYTGGKPGVVIEGMWSEKYMPGQIPELTEKNIIFYSGLLVKQYGVIDLIEAVKLLNSGSEDYELWICGAGTDGENILSISSKYSYIKYLGYVNTEEIKELQAKATVLINPRPGDDEFTRYSFPSKTISYMASGKPVISYKLEGIPNEYDDYLIYINSEGDKITNIANCIKYVCDMTKDKRNEIGYKNMQFVSSQKTPKEMCKKIIGMWRK